MQIDFRGYFIFLVVAGIVVGALGFALISFIAGHVTIGWKS